MKRTALCCFLLILGVSVSTSQEVGVRWGDVSGGDFAVDAVLGTAQFNRIHADVSFGDGVGLDVLWDLLYRPLGNEAIHYYAGFGPYAFFGDPFQLGVVGELGLEYRFKDIPIVVGGDWRPFFRIIDETDMGWGGFGFNVRYVF
jgi:hypothetical protein